MSSPIFLNEKFERLLKLFDEKALKTNPVFSAAKIAEETGEAIDLVLKLEGFTREKYTVDELKKGLSEELADIVITTYVCSKIYEIDLWKAVDRKLDVEISRWKNFETSI